jgi:hypothetical protein
VSISKAKKAIAGYKKAYCEEAYSFLEFCAFEDERYFVALIRMV